jgi:hypothetical protein
VVLKESTEGQLRQVAVFGDAAEVVDIKDAEGLLSM